MAEWTSYCINITNRLRRYTLMKEITSYKSIDGSLHHTKASALVQDRMHVLWGYIPNNRVTTEGILRIIATNLDEIKKIS